MLYENLNEEKSSVQKNAIRDSETGQSTSEPAQRSDFHSGEVGQRCHAGEAGLLRSASNESPWGPFESALAAAMNQVSSANLYPQSGFGELRQELATHFGTTVERIAVGAGSSALIRHLSVAVLEAGTSIAGSTKG